MANRGMSLVEYDLNQSPPLMNAFRGTQTTSLPIWFFVQMRLRMVKDFHKEWIFMIVSSHEPCEVDVPLYAYA